MTVIAQPTARRLQRPSWRDSRLVVGIVLVLLAAAIGARAVASTDDRIPVFVAATDLVAGDPVTAASLVRADVRLDDGVAGYLSAARPAPEGTFLLRDVRAGELVPTSAVGAAGEVGVQRVTVRSDATTTTGLLRGARVDVYVTPKVPIGSRDEPPATTRVLQGAGVAAVSAGGGSLGTSGTAAVQLYVPAGQVQTIIEAVDADARLTLVPVPGARSEPSP
ncbi:MAG: hypothetical protein ABIS35_04030 [Terracoccus sp.]